MKKIKVYIGDYIGESTIDANKHPQSQIDDLISLLTTSFENDNDELTINTNSIYVLNKLMVLQGYYHHGVKCDYFKYDFNVDVDVFEVKDNNVIVDVPKYKFLVSDDNLLNNYVRLSNDEYSEILINKK